MYTYVCMYTDDAFVKNMQMHLHWIDSMFYKDMVFVSVL